MILLLVWGTRSLRKVCGQLKDTAHLNQVETFPPTLPGSGVICMINQRVSLRHGICYGDCYIVVFFVVAGMVFGKYIVLSRSRNVYWPRFRVQRSSILK